jgi:excisionase family DNA binding protein
MPVYLLYAGGLGIMARRTTFLCSCFYNYPHIFFPFPQLNLGESMGENRFEVGSDVGIMTVHDVAGYLRLSEAKVYKMANEGRVPALRMGKSWRFKRELIDEWIRRETELTLHVSEQA